VRIVFAVYDESTEISPAIMFNASASIILISSIILKIDLFSLFINCYFNNDFERNDDLKNSILYFFYFMLKKYLRTLIYLDEILFDYFDVCVWDYECTNTTYN